MKNIGVIDICPTQSYQIRDMWDSQPLFGVSLSVKRDQTPKNTGLFEAICPTQSYRIRPVVGSQPKVERQFMQN